MTAAVSLRPRLWYVLVAGLGALAGALLVSLVLALQPSVLIAVAVGVMVGVSLTLKVNADAATVTTGKVTAAWDQTSIIDGRFGPSIAIPRESSTARPAKIFVPAFEPVASSRLLALAEAGGATDVRSGGEPSPGPPPPA